MYRSEKRFIPLLCLLVALSAAEASFGQSLLDRSDSIRREVEAGNVNAAVVELRKFQIADSDAFAANNLDYLMGRLLEQKGDRGGASRAFRDVLGRRSILSQYAAWHAARIARSSGDLVQERERLRQLLMSAPNSLLRNAATIRLAESFSESKDYKSAIVALKPLAESLNPSIARQALKRTGDSYLLLGKKAEARDTFTHLVDTIPDASRPDDFALAAVRALDLLDKEKSSAGLLETDHLQRAGIYQFNRDFDGARAHYLAIVSDSPQSSNVPDSLFQLGRGFYQQEKYDDAIKYLQKVQGQYESSSAGRDALALTAGAYVRLKRLPDAIATYKEFINRYPNAPNPERAYLNLIDALRDDGRDDEALSWISQTRARFKGQLGDTLALFSQARVHISQNNWPAALSDLDELSQIKDPGGLRIAGGTTDSEVKFLRALVLEQMGRSSEAFDAYLSIPDGRNEYYGALSNQRLTALASNIAGKSRSDLVVGEPRKRLEAGDLENARRTAQLQLRYLNDPAIRKDLLEVAAKVYEGLPNYKFPSFQVLPLGRRELINLKSAEQSSPTHQAIADELLFLGLYDEAAPELAAARTQPANSAGTNQQPANSATNPSDSSFTEAVFFLKGGMPYPAVRFAEQVWRSIPSDYLVELAPRQIAQMLYPAAYRSSILKHAKPRNLDPRFVLSIARQETRFQADAKSIAAARGLMQFIAATAEQTAKQLGRNNFDQDDLYDSDTAAEFGSHYLQSLFKQFPDQPQAVASAYNGGPDNIARWMRRSRSQDAQRYVSEIGFAQTKEYVFRVMANYWTYQKLYDDTLQPFKTNP